MVHAGVGLPLIIIAITFGRWKLGRRVGPWASPRNIGTRTTEGGAPRGFLFSLGRGRHPLHSPSSEGVCGDGSASSYPFSTESGELR